MAPRTMSINQQYRTLSLLFVFSWYCCLLVGISSSDALRVHNFADCSKCDCGDLPKVSSLDGRVVDVHASTTGDDWFTLNESIVSNQTTALFLRSVDPGCKVEIKFTRINSTADILMYPGGRIDPTATVLVITPGVASCRNNQWAGSSVLLGVSVVSMQQELAVAYVRSRNPLQQVAVDLQLLFRQHCKGTRNPGGFALPPPPVNGSTQKVQLVNPFGLDSTRGMYSTFIAWSITPPNLNCAVEVTFSKSTYNTFVSLNELNHALLGITHKVQHGVEPRIRLRKWMPNTPVAAAVTVEYRAVECGVSSPVNGTAIKISSWNNVVKPLKRADLPAGHDPWQEINASFLDNGAQQIAIWYLAGPEPDYVVWTSWTDTWSPDIIHLYRDDFYARFNSSILTGTTPFVFFSGAILTPIKYAFLPIATPPILAATVQNSTYQILTTTQDIIMTRRIYIKAANHSCSVGISGAISGSFDVHFLPFGFSKTSLNDIFDEAFSEDYYGGDDRGGIGTSLAAQEMLSIGPEMGIQFFGGIDLIESPIDIYFRMVCPEYLNIATLPRSWQYVSALKGLSYIIPPPPAAQKGDKQCWVDISGLSTSEIIPRDGSLVLLATCLQAPVRAKLLQGRQAIIGRDFNCTAAVQVNAYDAKGRFHAIRRNATLFAYRVHCDGDKVHLRDNMLAPLVPLDKTFVADSGWKPLDTTEYEYEMQGNVMEFHRQIWMIQAKRRDCRVEIHIDETIDLSRIRIAEDYMEDLRDLATILNGEITAKNVRYVSCDRRVFIAGLFRAVGPNNKVRYRQVCDAARTPAAWCSQNVTFKEPSLDKNDWQSLQAVSPGNLNQLRQVHYHIPFPGSIDINSTSYAATKLLELEFTSLVTAESWNGAVYDDFSRHYDPTAETHGVWLNDRIRAIVGKQYLFKSSVAIRLDSLLRTNKGDHLFTVRYRMVDAKQARQGVRLGEMLIATSKPKTLDFKIPQQFSTENLHQMLKKKQFEFEYEEGYDAYPSGDFPIWFFRHQYTIRPSNAKCQVVLMFTKMDIGSGYLLGDSKLYNNVQHRLSVTLNVNGSQRTPLACTQSMAASSSNETLCARMDRTYISRPGFALTLLFRSSDVAEYEYELPETYSTGRLFLGYDRITGVAGPEVTFGSGWTATYQQVCDSTKPETLLGPIHPTLVTAKPGKSEHDWHRNLPGQLKSDKYRLFRDKQWTITPQQPGCVVQYLVETKTKNKSKESIPVLFQFGSNVTKPLMNKIYTSPNVTVFQLGTSKTNPIMINYRQTCPTVAPTTPSPTVTAHSKVDGEICTNDGECLSGICSKLMQRCTAKTCAAQCATKASSQAICQAFVVVGCSCQFSSQTGSCLMIE